jgi:hypothetical protein
MLEGTAFGDYVQAIATDVLNGRESECWNCGAISHYGECASGPGSSAPVALMVAHDRESRDGL